MDGRGRAHDNIWEVWRNVEHEHVDLYGHAMMSDLLTGWRKYFVRYNSPAVTAGPDEKLKLMQDVSCPVDPLQPSHARQANMNLYPDHRMGYLWIVIPIMILATLSGRVWAYTDLPSSNNPCRGSDALLAILDRPTVGDSTCAVHQGRIVLEAGYAYSSLYPSANGHGASYPQLELRFGLPHDNEFVFLPAERVLSPGANGYTASVLGLKHEFDVSSAWQFAAESLVTLPSGDPNQGSAGTGVAVNGIASWSPSSTVGFSLMVGVTSDTEPTNLGGGRYTSFNPDGVVTWEFVPDLQLYAEVYGQSHTGVGQGSGYDADGGIQILLARNFELDFEAGTRLSGQLGGFSHYVGAGLGLEF